MPIFQSIHDVNGKTHHDFVVLPCLSFLSFLSFLYILYFLFSLYFFYSAYFLYFIFFLSYLYFLHFLFVSVYYAVNSNFFRHASSQCSFLALLTFSPFETIPKNRGE